MFKKSYQVFVTNKIDEVQNIVTITVDNLIYSSIFNFEVSPILFVYAETDESLEYLIKLYSRDDRARNIIPKKTPPKSSIWVRERFGFRFLPLQTAESFLILKNDIHSTELDYSVYFVPIYRLKFIVFVLLASLILFMLSLLSDDSIVIVIAFFHFFMWVGVFIVAFFYGLLLYFMHRKFLHELFKSVLHELDIL